MLFGACQDDELIEAFRRGGNVTLRPTTRVRGHITGLELSRLIRDGDAAGERSVVKSVKISRLAIVGLIDLSSFGSESSPIPEMSFIGCRFFGGMNITHSHLKSLTFDHCTLINQDKQEVSKIDGHRCIVDDQCEISHLHFLDPGVGLDLSGTQLRRGCSIRSVGGRACVVSADIKSRGDWISLKGATVTGDLEISNLSLSNGAWEHARSALNLERVTVTGTLSVRSERSLGNLVLDVFGQINLRSAIIKGRVRLESLHIQAPPERKTDENHRPSAIFGRLLRVSGDLLFRRTEQKPSTGIIKYRDVNIVGQIDLSDAHVEGDLDFRGNYDSLKRIRAIRCRRSTVGGHLRFGSLLSPSSAFACNIVGETDFTGAKIGGNVTFSGSDLRMSVVSLEAIKESRHKQGQAINFRYAQVARDMRFESGDRRCFAEGLSLIGATVDGRLMIGGSTISARTEDGHDRKAITANGAVIHGGIKFSKDEFWKEHECVIEGDIRLRNARVDGPFLIQGAKISASPPHKSSNASDSAFRHRGVAIWASNTRFGSDVLLYPSTTSQPTEVEGEIRLWGATIEGTLYLQGVMIKARPETATALDCYTADIRKGVEITSYFSPGARKVIPTWIEGIVGFNFAKLQSLRIGSYPKTILANASKKRGRLVKVEEDPTVIGSSETHLCGIVLLRNMQVEATSTFENLLLQHSGLSNIRDSILVRLDELQVFRPHTVMHANYANFGSRLYVHLNPQSVGLINLFAAMTGTIGGQTGPNSDKCLRENWGKPKYQWGNNKKSNLARKAWGNLPMAEGFAKYHIVLNLDEFKYSRVNDSGEDGEWQASRRDIFMRRWFWGQPFVRDIGPRFDWLQRQVNNPSDPKRAIISPYQQLAKVYREQGQLQRANNIVRARRWLQLLSPPEKDQNLLGRCRSRLQNAIDRVFSVLFGFGYSPARALATLISLWLFSLIVVSSGVSGCADRMMASNQAPYPFSVPTIPPTVVTHKIEHSSVGTSRTSSSTSDDASSQGHLGTSTRGRREQSYSVITDEVETPNFAQPTMVTKPLRCWGFFCDTSDHSEASACHLASNEFKTYDVGTEAAKVILPFTRLNASANCSVRTEAPRLFRFLHSGLEMASWILFPLAAVTFSGILREKSDG